MLIKFSGNTFLEVNRVVVGQNQCDELGHMNIQHYYAALSDGMFRVMGLIGIPKDHSIGYTIIFGKPGVKYARGIQSDGLHLNRIKINK